MVYNAVSVHRDRKLSSETFIVAMGQATALEVDRGNETDSILEKFDRLPTFAEIAELLVVEAMKMQNEIKAPKKGVVKKLAVVAGANVNAGDVLAIVE